MHTGAVLRKAAKKGAEKLCRSIPIPPAKLLQFGGCKLFAHTSDGQTLYAGVVHFNENLAPSFEATTSKVIGPLAGAPLRTALSTIRRQHQQMIDLAILAGFDSVYEQGGVTGPARFIADATVPFAAICFREHAIHTVLVGRVGGRAIYDAITPLATRKTYYSKRCSVPRARHHAARLLDHKAATAWASACSDRRRPGQPDGSVRAAPQGPSQSTRRSLRDPATRRGARKLHHPQQRLGAPNAIDGGGAPTLRRALRQDVGKFLDLPRAPVRMTGGLSERCEEA